MKSKIDEEDLMLRSWITYQENTIQSSNSVKRKLPKVLWLSQLSRLAFGKYKSSLSRKRKNQTKMLPFLVKNSSKELAMYAEKSATRELNVLRWLKIKTKRKLTSIKSVIWKEKEEIETSRKNNKVRIEIKRIKRKRSQ